MRRRILIGLGLPFVLAACAVGPSASSQATPSAAPSATVGATPTPSASVSTETPYDGVWASKPLTRADLAGALERRGLSDTNLDEWFPDWDRIDYRIFEIEIGGGRWLEYENAEGVNFGGGWAGDLEVRDATTIVATDDEFQCPVTYDMSRDGDTLAIHIADDACSDPADLPIQVTIYESSSFHLVQAAGWAAPEPSAEPSPSAVGSQTSTSRDRIQPRPMGSVDGAPLGYLEYLPPDYGQEPSPLLVFLHGSGESGSGDDAGLGHLGEAAIPQLIRANRWPDERPFVVLAPQHAEDPPDYCMQADEIDAFLQFALVHYDIDPSRVYLTGLSCGATGLWNYLGAHTDELVAAAVPIAGYGIGAVELAGCDLARVPIWAFHGSADENVFVRGDVHPIAALQSCTDPAPVDARLTVYPNAQHDVWTRTYPASTYDIYAWLLSHHK